MSFKLSVKNKSYSSPACKVASETDPAPKPDVKNNPSAKKTDNASDPGKRRSSPSRGRRPRRGPLLQPETRPGEGHWPLLLLSHVLQDEEEGGSGYHHEAHGQGQERRHAAGEAPQDALLLSHWGRAPEATQPRQGALQPASFAPGSSSSSSPSTPGTPEAGGGCS